MSQIRILTAGWFLLLSGAVFGAGHDACMGCHEADEFADYDAAEIADAIMDKTISPHRDSLSELSADQVEAVAAELAGE